jgi:hypothetical protein
VVVEAFDGILGKIEFITRLGQASERRAITALRTPLFSQDVGGNAIKPRQLRLRSEVQRAPAAPGF